MGFDVGFGSAFWIDIVWVVGRGFGSAFFRLWFVGWLRFFFWLLRFLGLEFVGVVAIDVVAVVDRR